MSLPLVIVNPTSAGGGTAEAWSQIASDLRSQFGAFQNVFTESAGHATTLASEAARKGVKLIVACGGDGTVSEVANGILSSGKDVERGKSTSDGFLFSITTVRKRCVISSGSHRAA
jgi:diacylglycerol kinase (ATP)